MEGCANLALFIFLTVGSVMQMHARPVCLSTTIQMDNAYPAILSMNLVWNVLISITAPNVSTINLSFRVSVSIAAHSICNAENARDSFNAHIV